MKVNEVPQEDGDAFGKEFPVIQYAVGDDGKFTTVNSVGWNPKTVVMKNAWDYELGKADEARQKVLQGKKSPIYFHMRKNMMSPRILAAYTGFWLLKVYRHFNPSVFRKLKPEVLQTYAQVFGYKSVEELNNTDLRKTEGLKWR